MSEGAPNKNIEMHADKIGLGRVVALTIFVLVALGGRVLAQPRSASSPREQLQQEVSQLRATPSDDALRTQVIKLALTLHANPPPSPELLEAIGAATYAFKNAQSDADLATAAGLYAKAALVAPWRPDLYYNEGVAFEKAKRFDEAIKAYQFYLLAAPDANDRDAVEEKIGGLKYALAQQSTATARQGVAAQETQQSNRLEGRYISHHREIVNGSNYDEDRILDVRAGQVTIGYIYTALTGEYARTLWQRLGQYNQGISAPLVGRSFHEEHHANGGGGTTDGTIAEMGDSAIVTDVILYPDGTKVKHTDTYYRQ